MECSWTLDRNRDDLAFETLCPASPITNIARKLPARSIDIVTPRTPHGCHDTSVRKPTREAQDSIGQANAASRNPETG
jgi:hypothetical protein